MKRGVITLEPSEQPLFAEASVGLPTITERFTVGNQAVRFELNSEQAESILDQLPAPDPTNPATVSLRVKLAQILV